MKRTAIWRAAAVIGGTALLDLCLGVLVGLSAPGLPLVLLGTINGAVSAVAGLLTRLRL